MRAAERGGDWVYTRNHPRRAAEVLAGGSIYWVVRGQVRVRQLVTGFRGERDQNGRRYCLIEVDGALVPTVSRTCRPFQGWRYLSAEAAPPDQVPPDRLPPDRLPADRRSREPPLPESMLAELRALGLL